MTEWREVALGDLCERVTVGHVGKMADEYVADGVPFLRSQNVRPFVIDRSNMLYIGDEFNARLRKSALAAGDVVVVRTGYPGTASVVPAELDGANCADLVVITPSALLNPHLLSAVFNSVWGRAAVRSQLVGSAQQHFNVGSAKALRVRLPDRAAQDQIASILCALNDLIENNRRRVEVLEEMARAIYREWFIHFRYPGHEGDTFVDSSAGVIPDQWMVTTLGKVAQLDRTSIQPARSPEESFDHYSIPAFDDGQLPAVDAGSTIKSGKFLVSSPAVLVSKLNPRIERKWFVEPGAIRRSVASTEFLVLRTGGLASLEWLYLMIGSESFQQRLRELSGGTSTSHQRAKPDDFLEIETLLPPTDMITRFADVVTPELALTRLIRIENRRLSELRDLLLPKLVTGQIDVSSLDLDRLVEDSVA
jgi:type I restriction enzyme S subunit